MTDADLIQSFVAEARDQLDVVEPSLIELSQTCDATGEIDRETVDNIFRLFHSMKGSAGFLQLLVVSAVTHEAETLLDLFRKGKAKATTENTNLLCRTLDFIRELLDTVEEDLTDSAFADASQPLVDELVAAIEAQTTSARQPQGGRKKKAKKKPAPVEEAPAAGGPPVADAGDVPAIEITQQMVDRFVQESDELLETTEEALLALDQGSAPGEQVSEAFRCIHSFKGNCGFMGFADLGKLSHQMEAALQCMKDGSLPVEPGTVELLLKLLDVLREAMAGLAGGGDGAIEHVDVYVELLGDVLPEASPPATVDAVEEDAADEAEDEGDEKEPDEAAAAAEPDEPAARSGDMESAPASPPDAGSKAQPAADTVRAQGGVVKQRDIRVGLEKLDVLVNLVGELVIAEAMVTRHPAMDSLEEETLERAIHQLRRVSSDLQDIAMAVRMVPLATTFRKMIRVVHDISNKTGKPAKLDLVGEDTEVDKTVIEQIADPLVHIVRNAVDHGLEAPEGRAAAGKPETGRVTIEGRHEGGEVWILISDDGGGLSRDRILAKALERGLVRAEEAEDLTDGQIFRLIFEPGFSTADKVSDISGRGVGMDVVKKNIERLKGRVDVRSQPGKGTTVILRIPLTLAIIEGMLVRVGAARYTIPLLMIRESFRPENKMVTVTPDGDEVVRLREEMIPVLRLHRLFRKQADATDLADGILIVVESEGSSVALFVDEILGQQETVIKGLSDYLGGARGISGCTILGDGEVSLILEVNSLVEMAGDTPALAGASG